LSDGSRNGKLELTGLLGDSVQRELAMRGLTPARAEVVWRLAQDGLMTQRISAERCRVRRVM
jgi:hypothetical protein